MALEWELEESLFERPSEDTTIQNAPANKKCIKGPVTDYSSTMVQWMRNRGPRDIKNPRLEQERPSASYIVDVSLLTTDRTTTADLSRCCRRSRG